MANTVRTLTGDGASVLFSVDFDLGFIERSHIYVYTGTDFNTQLGYTWTGATQIQLTVPPADGLEFYIRRVVPRNGIINDYEDGAAMQEENLDESFKQSVMIIEEIQDGYSNPDGTFTLHSTLNMNGNPITGLPLASDDTDAVTLEYLRKFVLDQEGAASIAERAETAAVAAEAAEDATTALYDSWRDDYAGSGPILPSDCDDGTLFYYDGASFTQGLYIKYAAHDDPFTGDWNLVSGVGPQGPTGATGIQGEAGVKGDQGLEGPQGSQGQQGIQGAIGDTGAIGVKGETGAQGPQGPQGVVGPKGDVGPQGPTGAEGPSGPQGIQGVIGPTGPQGDLGPQGQTGPTGPQGVQGVVGPDGPEGQRGLQGIQGNDGVQGVVGPTGDQGPTGITGDEGPSGPQGVQGVVGPQGDVGPAGNTGADGPIGLTGAQGITGQTGATGNDGQSFAIDAIGLFAERSTHDNEIEDFVYYATDYTVVGDQTPEQERFTGDGVETLFLLPFVPDGPQSLAVSVAGVQQGVDKYQVNITTLPDAYEIQFFEAPFSGADILVREFSISTGYGAMFIKNSATTADWRDPIPFGKGPRGDQGPAGVQGIDGIQGPKGNQGNIGVQGPEGDQGNVGITGPQGETGLQGSTGPTGPAGIQGDQGITGPQGPQGDVGVKGATGDQGNEGIVGPQGATGEVGPQGSTGATGDVGARGATGPQGATGLQGSIGPQGPVGIQGAEGIVGPQGANGDVGPQGAQGPGGDRGPIGIQGPEGDQGAVGGQGPQGNEGATGPQGAQGPVGSQGARGDAGATGPTGPKGTTGNTGAEGPDGADGAQGPPGIPLYTWQKFSDDDSGTNFSNVPLATSYYKYEAYNQTSPTASNDPNNAAYVKFLLRALPVVPLSDSGNLTSQGTNVVIATLTLPAGLWNVGITGQGAAGDFEDATVEIRRGSTSLAIDTGNSVLAQVSEVNVSSTGSTVYTVRGSLESSVGSVAGTITATEIPT